jgi:hypothetical protein
MTRNAKHRVVQLFEYIFHAIVRHIICYMVAIQRTCLSNCAFQRKENAIQISVGRDEGTLGEHGLHIYFDPERFVRRFQTVSREIYISNCSCKKVSSSDRAEEAFSPIAVFHDCAMSWMTRKSMPPLIVSLSRSTTITANIFTPKCLEPGTAFESCDKP